MLGTRSAAGQVWVEKPRLRAAPRRAADRARTAFDQWQEFGKIRFPAKIEISDDKGVVATLTVQSVNPIALSAADLQPSWVQAAPRRQGALSAERAISDAYKKYSSGTRRRS